MDNKPEWYHRVDLDRLAELLASPEGLLLRHYLADRESWHLDRIRVLDPKDYKLAQSQGACLVLRELATGNLLKILKEHHEKI